MEQGETSAAVEEQPPRNDGKDPLKIRIALFFDGTLNNRTNIEEREKNSLIYEKNRAKGPTSYDNGRTNIAIMEPHLLAQADGYDFCLKAYVEGQGTINFQKDTFAGYAAGGGEAGVVDRARKGVRLAVQKIQEEEDIKKEGFYIQKLTIDVFGFSRGAATARYAIHLTLSGQYGDNMDNLYELVERAGYDIEAKGVEVCFAGLYDTVLSYYGSQWFKRSNNVLQQMAAGRAKKVLHLAAADEHRKDFPLHNIVESSVSKGVGEEYYLPGVHSDVGGSYNLASELELKKQTADNQKVYMLASDEDLYINEGSFEAMERDRNYLIKEGWYQSHEINTEVLTLEEDGSPKHCGLKVNRQAIRSAYSNIPLKIMAEYVRKPEVKLQINPELEKRANRILNDEPDLQELEKEIKSYIASTKNSQAEDWIGERSARNVKALKDIRHKHFHFSAKPGAGYSPRFEWDKQAKDYRRRRFIYDA